ASAYEDPKEVIEFYSKNKELMDNIAHVALEEQAVEAVLAKAKVTEKETTFAFASTASTACSSRATCAMLLWKNRLLKLYWRKRKGL
ncbi:hypothetical protein PSY52_23025, partial [Shigella flexneri]|nr:hypothetical protein [Shigella flexneri]